MSGNESNHNIRMRVFAYLMKWNVDGLYLNRFDIRNGEIVNWKFSQHIPTYTDLYSISTAEFDAGYEKYTKENIYFRTGINYFRVN